MKKTDMPFIFIILIFFLNLASLEIQAAPEINDYHPVFIPGIDKKNNMQIAIRMYMSRNKYYFLTVNPYTLITQILPVSALSFRKNFLSTQKNDYFTAHELQNTPYLQALQYYTSPPYKLQNQGLIKADHPSKGMILTVDMCPSNKFFEKRFFNSLVDLADKYGQPIPFAISVSGLWVIKHPSEMQWLINKQKQNKFSITWINHSLSHNYYKNLPLKNNFMLAAPEYFISEVLAVEKILLQKSQTPSIFFRFPGLVANKELILKLRELGLIPVGSNAWLAKNEQPKAGSIILVHGNANEPRGIKMITPLINNTYIHWLPLRAAILKNSNKNN